MIAPFIFTTLFALYCAQDDARQIQRGVTIKHASQWIVRAGVVVVFMVCYVVLIKPTIAQAILIALSCAPLFSMVFRFLLNTMMGKPWWYMSPSSGYDWKFIYLAGIKRAEIGPVHWSRVQNWPWYGQCVRRAGRSAYITEAVVFALLAFIGERL